MKKRILLLSLTLVLAFSGIVYAAAVNGTYQSKNIVKVTLDGREIKPDKVPGYLESGSTMIPLGMLRSMGVTVEWNAKTLTANVKLPTRTVPILTAPQLEQLSEYVYEIQAPLPDNPAQSRQGSGFLIGSTMITNAHVIGDSKWVQVFIDGKWQRVDSFQFVNTETDLAGFTVTGGKSLPYSTELPRVGDIVYSISFPHGNLEMTEGTVFRVDETEIVHTAKTDPGSSGGVLLSGRGEVIGINKIGTTAGANNFSWAIPISYALDEINN